MEMEIVSIKLENRPMTKIVEILEENGIFVRNTQELLGKEGFDYVHIDKVNEIVAFFSEGDSTVYTQACIDLLYGIPETKFKRNSQPKQEVKFKSEPSKVSEDTKRKNKMLTYDLEKLERTFKACLIKEEYELCGYIKSLIEKKKSEPVIEEVKETISRIPEPIDTTYKVPFVKKVKTFIKETIDNKFYIDDIKNKLTEIEEKVKSSLIYKKVDSFLKS